MEKFTAYTDYYIGERDVYEDVGADIRLPTEGQLELQLGIVCDGLGGRDVGEIASEIAIEAIKSSIRSSYSKDIPQILTNAVQYANLRVMEMMQNIAKDGSTTVAMFAIDVHDGEFGRLFVASVGDSRVCVLRADEDDKDNIRLIRLNRDHTRGYDEVMRGNIHPDQIHQVDRWATLTRALGVIRNIDIDTGIYSRKGHDFVDVATAMKIGQKGILLREGDTVFASSDGPFDINPKDSQPYIREEEFIRHALDNDVAKAVKTLTSFTKKRLSADNVTISMLFVDSPKRSGVRAPLELTPIQKVMAGIGTSIITVAILFLIGLALIQGNTINSNVTERNTQIAQTSIAANNTKIAREAFDAAKTNTPTPTVIPTATSLPTQTPIPTATSRPQIAGSDLFVGHVYDSQNTAISGLEEGVKYITNGIDHTIISGFAKDKDDIDIEGFWLAFPGSAFNFETVRNIPDNQKVELLIEPQADVFFNLGDYANGGAKIRIFRSGLALESTSACISVDLTQSKQVAFTCYGLGTEDCSTEFNGDSVPLPSNEHIILDIDTGEIISSDPVMEVNASKVVNYFNITLQRNTEAASCLKGAVDSDGDNILYDFDDCPTDNGIVNEKYPDHIGCPDRDGDLVPDAVDDCPEVGASPYGINDVGCPNPIPDNDRDTLNNSVDRCPNSFGPVALRGCPDSDNDNISDIDDSCPYIAGIPENNGCPVIGSGG